MSNRALKKLQPQTDAYSLPDVDLLDNTDVTDDLPCHSRKGKQKKPANLFAVVWTIVVAATLIIVTIAVVDIQYFIVPSFNLSFNYNFRTDDKYLITFITSLAVQLSP